MQQVIGELLQVAFTNILKDNVSIDAFNWLQEKAQAISTEQTAAQLNLAFVAVPRKTGKHPVKLTKDQLEELKFIHPQFSISDWAIDRLSRVWLILQVDASDKESYLRKIENLFKAAEMNELAALYSALYGLHYPEDWQKQCAEGIRSNIGIVLEAIMYNNPYASIYLSEAQWNQLVLKAFFTEKEVKRIIGLDDRANKELTTILIDYANERWAAHRTVNPQLWRLVAPFIDDNNFINLEKAFNSKDTLEQQAAGIALHVSPYQPAHNLLAQKPELQQAIIENRLNWNSL